MDTSAGQDMLYQGNFDSWKDTVDGHLKSHSLEGWNYEHAEAYRFRTINPDKLSDVDHAVDIILRKVPASLRRTVPNHLMIYPYALWKHLEQYSKPFRLLDLPPELRETILLHSFGQEVVHPGDALPPILIASKQLRAESRKLYYQESHFYLDFEAEAADRDQVEENCETRVQFLNYWVKKWITNEVNTAKEHLRHVVLYIEEIGFEISLSFASKEDKLCVKLEQKTDSPLYEVDEGSLVGLGEYVDMIEQRRKEGICTKGEAIVDALLHTPKKWGYGVIKMKEIDVEDTDEENDE
ncbi:hypothetical protein HII31_00205 [Pseudocercospora fuligena]|uniref:F-box domain-containing protein n=1 Tax=Pseudocercospora fuligena TaxID=685502 RepID=A0A8H6RU62_9PEZI|nr:hypothetical protein HII31_00205 [Pseudocercospora fuligena]